MFLPKDTNRQKIDKLDIYISDKENYRLTEDNFGNRKFYGLIEKTHDRFEVIVSGEVQTGLDICEEFTLNPFAYSFLKAQTALTQPGEKIKEYHKSLELEKLTGDYDKAKV